MGDALSYAKGTLKARIDSDSALAFLGHTGQALDRSLKARLEEMARRCEDENTPRYLWRTFDIDSVEETISLRGSSLELPGASIRAHLDGATGATLLAVTLGVAWRQTLEQLNATSPTDALLYDACANALTEAAAEEAHRRLAEAAATENREAHARFSPGYGDLPLSIQPAFLKEIDAPRKAGIIATADNLLEPAKSITAIVGLFPLGSGSANGDVHLCERCAAHAYCNFRERGTTCCG